MAQNYTRQSSFADGDTITSALFNNEYNQLVNAFAYSSSSASSTGHRHDGTAGQGGNIPQIGDLDFLNKIVVDDTNNRWGFYVEVSSAAVEQIRLQDGALLPVTDSDVDLGTSSLYFKDAYIDSITTTGNVAVGGNLTVTGTTTFNGGTLTLGDSAADNVVFGADVDSNIIPDDDNTYDLGSSSQEWKDLYIDGTANIDTLSADTAAIGDLTSGRVVLAGTSGELEDSSNLTFDGSTLALTGAATVSTNLTVSGNTTLGNAASDTVTVTADVASNLIPSADSTYSLGDSSNYWSHGYIDAITTTGNVSVGGNLTVTGTTTFNGGTLTLGDAADDNVVFGADVNSNIIPNTDNTYDLGSSTQEWKDLYVDGVAYLDEINFNGTAITSTAAELNILDGVTSTAAELNLLDGVTATTAELNILDGVTSTAAELNILDGVTSTAAELNILDGVTSTAAELNILDGVTSTAAELNILDGVTSTTAELNLLDGVTATTTELNYVDVATAGTVEASKAIVVDSNKDFTGARNITLTGELDAATLDISGDADIDGTLEADAITIGGVTLAETISDTVGAMVTSNTETGVTVTYDDSDNTLDFVIGTLNQDTTGNAATATALETARTIGGVSFDGTANITPTTFTTATFSGDVTVDTSTLKVDSTNNRVGIGNASPDVSLDVGSFTDAIHVPVGTTAQRPGSPAAGYFRYNTTTGKFEGYTDEWGSIGGGSGTNMDTNIYTGDGSTTAFTLSTGADDENNLMVFIDGVFQAQNVYSVSGTTLTFATAPASGRVITVYHSTTTVGGSNNSIATMTGDGSDTTLTLSVAPVHENNVQVYFDGVYQSKSNYSISGTTLTFSTAPPSGVAVEAITATTTSSTTANLLLDADSDTKIQVEESSDEDKIRFDTGGTERVVIDSTGVDIAGPVTATGTSVFASLDISGDIDVDGTTNLDGVDIDGAVNMASNLAVDGNLTMGASSLIRTGDGTAALPGIRVGVDNDTGFYRPLANTIGFTTVGTERMRLDAYGNVGIGETDPDGYWGQAHNLVIDTSGNGGMTIKSTTSGNGRIAFTDTKSSTAGLNDGGLISYLHSADAMSFQTNGSERMRIDSSGNIGIGTTSPSEKFHVSSGTGNVPALFESTDATSVILFKDSGTSQDVGVGAVSNNAVFYAGHAEKMRLHSSGKLTVGATPTASNGVIEANYSGNAFTLWLTTTAQNYLGFESTETGGQAWSLRTAGSGTYGSANGDLIFVNGTGGIFLRLDQSASTVEGDLVDVSDVGLKENITDTTDGLTKLLQLKARKFDWKDEDKRNNVNGFIAQEVETVLPNEVIGDDYDENNPLHGNKSINTSGLLAVAVKAIQEQQTIIEDLKARIETLEG